MDKLNTIKTLADKIRSVEDIHFEYNETAIVEDYEKLHSNKSNIAIKILSIFGGFIAMLTFLGFLFLSGLFNSEIGLVITGGIFLVSAILLNKLVKQLLADTLSISAYSIGLFLIGFGLFEIRMEENLIMIIIAIIAFSTILVIEKFILNFLSILVVNGCLMSLIITNNTPEFIHLLIAINTFFTAYLFLNEAKIYTTLKVLSKLYNPLRIGVVISLLAQLVLIGKKDLILINQNTLWLSSLVMIIVIFYLVTLIVKNANSENPKFKALVYTTTSILLILLVLAPSILGAIVIVLLSFLVNYKTGLSIGIVALIYFISQYYYDLNYTLLTKSILLFTSGLAFLLLYFFISKRSVTNEEN